jgi:hypothetical protein
LVIVDPPAVNYLSVVTLPLFELYEFFETLFLIDGFLLEVKNPANRID